MRRMCLVLGLMACTGPQQAPPNPVVEGQMHFNLGLSHAQFRRFPEAIAAYERALALMPDLPQVHYNLANVHFSLDALDRAEAGYRRAIASTSARRNTMTPWCRSLGRCSYSPATCPPITPWVYYTRGWARMTRQWRRTSGR